MCNIFCIPLQCPVSHLMLTSRVCSHPEYIIADYVLSLKIVEQLHRLVTFVGESSLLTLKACNRLVCHLLLSFCYVIPECLYLWSRSHSRPVYMKQWKTTILLYSPYCKFTVHLLFEHHTRFVLRKQVTYCFLSECINL